MKSALFSIIAKPTFWHLRVSSHGCFTPWTFHMPFCAAAIWLQYPRWSKHNGVPIDTATLDLLKASWTDIQDRLIAEIDKDYGVFDGRTFKADRFEDFIRKHGIPWGRTESGRLELNDDAFRQAAKAYPILSPLRELRASLSEMRLSDLAVGADGRNRCLLSPFGRAQGAINPATRGLFSAPLSGCAVLLNRLQAMASLISIGRNRNLALPPASRGRGDDRRL